MTNETTTRAHILREIEEINRELNDALSEVSKCESYIAELEAELRINDEPEKIACAANQIAIKHRPSGYEDTILCLAANRIVLDQHQYARLQLLAREYFISL